MRLFAYRLPAASSSLALPRSVAIRAAMMLLCCCLATSSAQARAQVPPQAQTGPAQPQAETRPVAIQAIPKEFLSIPGPLRSFLRISGISQEAAPADVVPLLARQVYQQGYVNKAPTEFLIIIERYLIQARELQVLAGSGQTIRVPRCEDAGALLQVLGYKLRRGCGTDALLETDNPERAFLTTDSGFPLTDLEEALQHGAPFTYAYPSTRLPVFLSSGDLASLRSAEETRSGDGLDILLHEPVAARMYWALSKMDEQTRAQLQSTLGLKFLLANTIALDFYGSEISIRGGKVLVPGGAGAEPAWTALVGASPEAPGRFAARLLREDDGWLAAYFDVLSRLNITTQEHLTQADRLPRYFAAFRTGEVKGTAWSGIARPASELLVLYTRLLWEPNGEPHVPGSLPLWGQIFQEHADDRIARAWMKRAQSFARPDQLVQAMTALSRSDGEANLLQLYLTVCELDRRRPPQQPVSADTIRLIASAFPLLNHWISLFSEFPDLNDQSITRFVQVAQAIDGMRNQSVRGNAMGSFQANIGIWQVLARQGEIPRADFDRSWGETIEPFLKVTTSPQLLDAARTSLRNILVASGAGPDSPPSEIVERLAGPAQPTAEGQRMHDELVARMRSVLDDQRLVSLDTLFALSDGLEGMKGTAEKSNPELLSLAGELREFELPRPIFSRQEKISWAPAVYVSHHAELQVQTDISKVIRTSGTRAQLETARGQLAPFLRDTLVGLNYAYYEPPGAQILHVNSLFVRAHDFLGISVIGSNRTWQPPVLLGSGVSAGGGAYLMGSLADLPYVLASAEQDFIVPEKVQALVWKELVPDLMEDALLPRWWGVSAQELHAAALYQRSGEELLRSSASQSVTRARVTEILSSRISPRRLETIAGGLPGRSTDASYDPRLTPSELFYLAAEYRRSFPAEADVSGPAGNALATLALAAPGDADVGRIGADFGVPHPTMAQTNARELFNVQPFPFSVGYTNRLFGESMESCNLYWARLADELGYAPVTLHVLVPELTRHMVGKIFATNIEDWPAVERAMQETGQDLRQGKIASLNKLAGGGAGANIVSRQGEP